MSSDPEYIGEATNISEWIPALGTFKREKAD